MYNWSVLYRATVLMLNDVTHACYSLRYTKLGTISFFLLREVYGSEHRILIHIFDPIEEEDQNIEQVILKMSMWDLGIHLERQIIYSHLSFYLLLSFFLKLLDIVSLTQFQKRWSQVDSHLHFKFSGLRFYAKANMRDSEISLSRLTKHNLAWVYEVGSARPRTSTGLGYKVQLIRWITHILSWTAAASVSRYEVVLAGSGWVYYGSHFYQHVNNPNGQ